MTSKKATHLGEDLRAVAALLREELLALMVIQQPRRLEQISNALESLWVDQESVSSSFLPSHSVSEITPMIQRRS